MTYGLGVTVTSAGGLSDFPVVSSGGFLSLCFLLLCNRSDLRPSVDSQFSSSLPALSEVCVPLRSCGVQFWRRSGRSALLQCGVV